MHCSHKFGKAGVSTATMAADEHLFTDDARPTKFLLFDKAEDIQDVG